MTFKQIIKTVAFAIFASCIVTIVTYNSFREDLPDTPQITIQREVVLPLFIPTTKCVEIVQQTLPAVVYIKIRSSKSLYRMFALN